MAENPNALDEDMESVPLAFRTYSPANFDAFDRFDFPPPPEELLLRTHRDRSSRCPRGVFVMILFVVMVVTLGLGFGGEFF